MEDNTFIIINGKNHAIIFMTLMVDMSDSGI